MRSHISFFTLFFTLIGIASYALPIGNPSDQRYLTGNAFFSCCDSSSSCLDCFDMSVSFYGDYVFNRKLEVTTAGNVPIHKTEIYTNAAYLSVGYCKWIEAFATLGTSSLSLTFDQPFLSEVGGMEEIEAQTSFSWSLGLKTYAFQFCGWQLGLEGQYFRTYPHLSSIAVAGVQITLPFIQDIDFLYQEWQIGSALSYPICVAPTILIVPYLGYKFSYAKLSFFRQELQSGSISLTVESNTLENARHYGGYAFGVSLIGGSVASISAEVRFMDEKAVHVNCLFNF